MAIRTIGPQYESLMERRNELADKEILETIEPAEAAELRYVRWQLDRYESAAFAPVNAEMEAVTRAHEKLAAKLQAVLDHIGEVRPSVLKDRRSSGR
jgi:hypothetical protein